MTCHFFRHHPGPNCIPLLTCHLHQGLARHVLLKQFTDGQIDVMLRPPDP
jgi:hypothetical protein